jgi:DNA modification methylase
VGKILVGDAIEMLSTLPAESVDCVVTSPPYWGLRDYGMASQLGMEATPEQYVGNMRMIFEQVSRVLKKNGTLWLNLGDSYARAGGTTDKTYDKRSMALAHQHQRQRRNCKPPAKLKAKDLVGIPWRVAFALQADGWYLRQDIIWQKNNPMPESVRDRCTKAHEYIFLMTKSGRYYFDVDAIKEAAKYAGPNGAIKSPHGQGFTRSGNRYRKQRPNSESLNIGRQAGSVPWEGNTRQKRSVWTVSTKPFKGAHFATFPEKLIEPCILAGCPIGGTVLDPFFGAGTVGLVAKKHGRKFIGIEINPAYAKLAKDRIG